MFKTVIATMLLTGGLVASAFAADDVAIKQASTAVMHARFSSEAKDIAGVHLHLHHVVNCLVGKDGDGFDAGAGDPCQGMGNGAVNDATEFVLKTQLDGILKEANKGLADDNVDSARKTASRVHEELQKLLNKK